MKPTTIDRIRRLEVRQAIHTRAEEPHYDFSMLSTEQREKVREAAHLIMDA